MSQTQNYELLTKSSLQLARQKIEAGDFDGAFGVIRKVMALLYETRDRAGVGKYLADCYETLGDGHRLCQQYEAALSAYEETLAMRTRDNGECGDETMTVLYKLERTLMQIARASKYGQRQQHTGPRWRAHVLTGQFSAMQANEIETKTSIPVPKLNSLWEDAMRKNKEQLEQRDEEKRTAETLKKMRELDQPKVNLEKVFDMGGQMVFRFLPIIILCLLVGIVFKSFDKLSGGAEKTANSSDFKYFFSQPAEQARDSLHGIASGTNKLFESGDQGQQIKFDQGQSGQFVADGQTYTMPYLVDDGSALSRWALCVHTLFHRQNIWLVPNLYGLEDDHGNVYFDVGSSEFRVAKQMRDIAKQLKTVSVENIAETLKEIKYDDPFDGKQEPVVFVQVKAASISQALEQLAPQLRNDSPGTVVCIAVDSGANKEIALCAIDRQRGLIPFGNREHNFLSVTGVEMPPQAIDPRLAGGIVILPVPSTLAHNAGVLMCGMVAVLFSFGFVLFHKSVWRWAFLAVTVGCVVLALIGLLSH